MPYSMGGDRLEKVKALPKKTLNPDEEDKLSGDMRELYDRLLPSQESEQRRASFVAKLDKLLNDEWPGSNIKVNVFGSSGNLLCTSDSDVDICITTTMKELEKVCLLANALAEHGMERVVCVPHAKVPIVKIWDPELELACDMNVNNTLALENTRMIKSYVEIDERVRPLAMIVKHWTKKRILNDAALGGTLSSYTWICMIINFLQTRDPPILPVLHQRPHQKRAIVNGIESSFVDDVESLRGLKHANKESLGELLFQFFRRYGHEIDYEKNVISVRQGKLISKEEKGWHLMQNNRLCVEEPFNTTRNLGNTADDTSFRGLHIELRRAFTLIAEASNLQDCCEQYVFPVEEERIFAKPAPQPRPILSRSTSQSGRSGRGGVGSLRGGKHSNSQHNRLTQSNRRASSGASFTNGHSTVPPSPQLLLHGRDYYLQAQHQQSQLHDQLFHHYQLLQVQENELRYQLIQQAQVAQVAQVAQAAQAHAMAAHGRGQSTKRPPSQASYTNGHSGAYTTTFDNPPLTAPLRNDLYYYPLQHPSMPSHLQHGTNTNPPSPSMSPAMPELRRSIHRASATHESANGLLRSHSQPPRTVPTPLSLPLNGFYASNLVIRDPPVHQHMDQSNGTKPVNAARPDSNLEQGRTEHVPLLEPYTDDSFRKEYVGYYLGGSPPIRPQLQHSVLQQIPAFHDLHRRQRRISPDQLPPPFLDRLQRSSRSPSPLGRDRSISQGLRSAPLNLVSTQQLEKLTTGQPKATPEPGPLIVNGSSSAAPVDLNHHMSLSESTSASDDQPYDTPSSTSDTLSQDHVEPSLADCTRQQLYTQELLKLQIQTESARAEYASPVTGLGPLTEPFPTAVTYPPFTYVSSFPGAAGSTFNQPEDNERERSPRLSPNLHQRISRRPSLPPLGVVPLLDPTKALYEPPHNDGTSKIPLLSPVPETRTPSPSKGRKQNIANEHNIRSPIFDAKEIKCEDPQPLPTPATADVKQKPVNGVGDKSKEPASIPSGKPLKNVKENNTWQQTGKKASRKRSRSNAVHKSGSNSKVQVEPLPAKESDRKGG
ncbi:MAG: hypothetical protein M1827_004483 [Pycnora praestabilis]|nr:MAG: hypothetical protein M1827_004483 [Pycnora praestabilis]